MYEKFTKIFFVQGKLVHRVLRVMKLTAILLLVSLLQLSAATFGQRVTIKSNKISFEQVLLEIKKQTKYDVLISTDKYKDYKKFNINFFDSPISAIMDYILYKTDLMYTIDNDSIIISEKKKEAENLIFETKVVEIKGKVVDEKGLPLPGASITEKDTQNHTQTNGNGEFTIKVASAKSILVIRFVGYVTKNVEAGTSPMTIKLEPTSQILNEVVVTGMETIKKKLFTGATQNIKMEDIKLDGATDVSTMLQGRAAGVNIQNITSTFGAAPKISIRGGSSIFGQTSPLWVIDGVVREDIVEQSNEDLTSGNAQTLIGSTVAGINTNDIENIDILRDASATSLYGARAMNGVIVITTKKGKRDTPTQINYTGEFTVREIPNYSQFDVMNSYDNMTVLKELESKQFLTMGALAGVSNSGVFGMAYDRMNTYDESTGKFLLENTTWALNNFLQKYESANTDWFKTLFKNSVMQRHNATFTGGGAKNSYYASVGYLTDPGWTVADKVNQLTLNIKNTFYFSDKVNLTLSTLSSIRKQRAPGTLSSLPDQYFGSVTRDFDINPFNYALSTSRMLRPRDENGNLEYYRANFAPFNILSELENNYMEYNVKDFQFQADFKYNITKKIDFSTIASARYANSERETFALENSNRSSAYRAAQTDIIRKNNRFLYKDPQNESYVPTVAMPYGGIYENNADNLLNYYVRNSLHFYDKIQSNHDLDVLVAQELRYVNRNGNQFTGYGMQFDDGYVPNVDIKMMQKIIDENKPYYGVPSFRDRSVAFLGKATYGYKEKYIISLSGRYDGSNRQGEAPSSRWLPTWTVSGKWAISSEEFMANFIEKTNLSGLQFRASYGLTANTGPATNAYAIYKNSLSINRVVSTDREPIINIEELANSLLTWEKNYNTNLGLDFSFFKNRFNFSVDVYNKKSFNLIDQINASGIGGELVKRANNADMKTRGIELSVSTTNIKSGNFTWRTSLNFDHFKQEITKLDVRPIVFDMIRVAGGNIVGYPRNSLFSLDFAGLNNLGIPQFRVIQGGEEKIVTTDVDMQNKNDILSYLKYEGAVDPNTTLGLSNNFDYKNWSFSFFIYGSMGNKIRKTPKYSSKYSEGFVPNNDFLNRWILPGDENITNIPTIASLRQIAEDGMLSRAYNAYNYSSAQVADGYFIRLRNVSLSYRVPQTILKKIGLNSASFRLAATNPWLIYSDSKLNGADPEFYNVGGVVQPVSKQYILSLNIGI
jgi:TonB-linked SusC/RagA family outer membrane protein